MSRVKLITADTATGETKTALGTINGAFGNVPNMFAAVANSPAALQSLWGSFGALGQGVLGAKLGEQIAVAVADSNDCQYCLSAHTALGTKAGATTDEMSEAQEGRSSDPRTAAALTFALKLVKSRGKVSADDVQAVRTAGFDDGEVVEIIAHVALNLFTNYVNVALDVPLDFPAIRLRKAA